MLCPFAGMGRPPKTPIFVAAVTIGTHSDAPPPAVPLGMRPLLGAIPADPLRVLLAEPALVQQAWDDLLAGRA